jgi:PAS domain S-box-containing protein
LAQAYNHKVRPKRCQAAASADSRAETIPKLAFGGMTLGSGKPSSKPMEHRARTRRPLLVRYGIAIVIVTLTALVHWGLLGPRFPFLSLLPAIVAVAWYGGLGPGLWATALGALVAAYVFFEPRFSLHIDDPAEVLALAIFASLGTAISLFSERRLRSEQAKRQAEEQALLETQGSLRESREQLGAVVRTAADAIFTIDARGIIHSVNPAAEKMFGYSADELIGHNVNMLMPYPYRNEHDGYLARYLQTGEKRLIGLGREVQGRRKDGSTFPVDLAVSEFRHQTRPMFTGVLRDISARKQLERDVLEAATQQQRRIGQALHDSTGQELTALGLLAETLCESLEQRAPDICPLAGKVREGLKRALSQVRAYSRGLIPVELDSRGLRAALAELASRTNDVPGVRCALACQEPVAVENHQTATHLYHIAQEAVSNALRHAQARQITISLEDGDGFLSLRVSDDGIGLPPDPAGSSGLGLKLMHYRAGLIQARLTVEAAEPVGTLVACTLRKGASDV